jgi:hypothetical protein
MMVGVRSLCSSSSVVGETIEGREPTPSDGTTCPPDSDTEDDGYGDTTLDKEI